MFIEFWNLNKLLPKKSNVLLFYFSFGFLYFSNLEPLLLFSKPKKNIQASQKCLFLTFSLNTFLPSVLLVEPEHSFLKMVSPGQLTSLKNATKKQTVA